MAEAAKETTEKTDTTSNESQSSDVKKEIPKDVFSDVIPEAEVLPLDGEVKQQAHGILQDNTTQTKTGDTATSTPGGDTKPPVTDNTAPTSDLNANPAGSTITAATPAKTPEEIRTEAEQMVAMLIRGYEKLHGFGRWAGKIDNSMLINQHLAGKIDLNLMLPLSNKGPVPVSGFFNNYNASIDENIVVTDKFKEEIKPPLVRIAIKREWALGDELFVLFLLSEDLATKISMLIGLKKAANSVLEACYSLMKQKNAPPPKQEQNQQQEQNIVTDLNTNNEDNWHKEADVNSETPAQD